MKRMRLTRLCIILSVAILATLWLKELTHRRAIEIAGFYVYPFDTLAPYSYSVFSITGTRRPSGKLTGPGWVCLYGNSTFMPAVTVSIFGNVKGSDFKPLDDVLALSDYERQTKLIKWVETERTKQRAASLPPAPKPGHSEGAP
jgi:hypothetical protein